MGSSKEKFMHLAIDLATENIKNGGGPFGAVIVKDGEVIATGCNRVTASNDPTAHAEVSAIRAACKDLDAFNLEGCEIYSSCEPCPMCLGAIYWAHIDKIYYAANKHDAADAGFDDSFIYNELELTPEDRRLKTEVLLEKEALRVFESWKAKEDKVEY
ncbi:MAG: nucleoside deaminase [Bacteroidales bacterium]|jgi:guanine deaminase|nr:nucleoside deaminase [Bacteroidales bacterium]